MHEEILISGRDTLLVAIPFLVLFVVSLFRLDAIFSAPKGGIRQRQPLCGMNENGKPVLIDPDGKHPAR
jgi:hypothetical protein